MLEMDVLFPGKGIELNEKLIAHVYPIGLQQLKKYSNRIFELFKTVMGSIKVDKKSSFEQTKNDVRKALTPEILQSIVPMLSTDFVDIISECVMLEIKTEGFKDKRIPLSETNVPHFYLPKIITAWVQENFEGDERLNPWKEAVNDVIKRLN